MCIDVLNVHTYDICITVSFPVNAQRSSNPPHFFKDLLAGYLYKRCLLEVCSFLLYVHCKTCTPVTGYL